MLEVLGGVVGMCSPLPERRIPSPTVKQYFAEAVVHASTIGARMKILLSLLFLLLSKVKLADCHCASIQGHNSNTEYCKPHVTAYISRDCHPKRLNQ